MDEFLEVEKYRERLHLALKAAKICVFEVDLKKQLYTFFENAEDIFGVSGEVILKDVEPFSKLSPDEYQKAVSEYFSHPDDALVINHAFHTIFSGKSVTYQARMRAGGSDFLWCKLDVTPIMENGIPVKMIGVITDISDINKKMNTLKKAVKVDSFTGLYNKTHAIESIKKVLGSRPNQKHALILLDIDHFKSFNDTYGHDVGDMIIHSISDSLKHTFQKTDIIGRFGGDEFILLICNIPSVEWLSKKLQILLQCQINGYHCTNSMGVSIYPENGEGFDALFKAADKALYQAKLSNRAFSFFSDIAEH